MDDDIKQAHAERFRKVSTRYPRRVAEAYEGDLERAMADTDEQVMATVHRWEMGPTGSGRITNWHEVGRRERGER